MRLISLPTEYEEELTNQKTPYPEYPRPQMKRDSFINLNGLWDFKVINKGKCVCANKILVPFVPESRISGLGRATQKGDLLVYERTFMLENISSNHVILHFGACDQITKVFVNEKLVGENFGGYLPFEFDITNNVSNGENKIAVHVKDELDKNFPYGKQTKKRGGMWYTKISGIWQTVWIEKVPRNHIKKIKITPDLNGVDIKILGGEEDKTIVFQGEELEFKGSDFRLNVKNPIHWTPENPHLYDFSVISGGDKIDSYFALRTIGIAESNGKQLLTLNGTPYFFHGLLDQGYYSDGIFLPATSKGYADDIIKMKNCGFNMLRKHIKTEPELFYYYCDKFGMIVFQDFINNGNYSFLRDTALPTIGLKKIPKPCVNKRRKQHFRNTAVGIMDVLHNHPSVVYYTIFNEGWGQHNSEEYYEFFKNYDPTRIFDTASGWFKTNKTDVESPHVYFKPIKLKSCSKPIILSEFGGYSYKVNGHSFNLDKNYGYRTYKTRDEFEKGIIELYEREVVPAIKNGLCGTVLTQLSDVEDETNGILTYDRKVQKIPAENLNSLSQKIFSEFKKLYY